MVAQAVGNGGEVGVVRAHDDGDGELGRLEGVVAAGRNEAATDECDGGQRVNRGQFADGVEQNDLAGFERRADAGCAADDSEGQPERLHHGRPDFSRSAATALKRSGWRGASTSDELRIGGKQAGPRFKERGFLAFERAAGDDEPQPGGHRLQLASGFGFLRGADIELEIAGDGDAIRAAAEREQAVGVGLALGKHAAEPARAAAATGGAAFGSAARSGRRCGR